MEADELCVSQILLSQNTQGKPFRREERRFILAWGFSPLLAGIICFWVSEAEHYGGRKNYGVAGRIYPQHGSWK